MKKFIFFAFFTWASINAQAQFFKKDLSLFAGWTINQQDRRLFDYPNSDHFLKVNPNDFDYSYTVGVKKHFFARNRINIDAGLGYYAQISTFYRPFVHNYSNFIPAYLRRYTVNQLAIPLTIRGLIDNSHRFGLQVSIINNIAVHKRAISSFTRNLRNEEWGIYHKSLDINPGVFIRLSNKLHIEANYRLWYLNRVEKWFFYDSVFEGPGVPEAFEQRYETYTPRSFQVLIGYKM